MMKRIFTRAEISWLVAFAVLGLASYLSGFDYWFAENAAHRTTHGISLFFSVQYYAVFMIVALISAYIIRPRAAAALAVAIVAVFLMQGAFTEFSPRTRPSQALPSGIELLHFIQRTGGSSSFFSGHTASSVAVFAFSLMLGFHPRPVLALVVPIILSRLALVQHYPSDVFGGVIFGYVTAKVAFGFVAQNGANPTAH